jgi:ankyrin repeat protein
VADEGERRDGVAGPGWSRAHVAVEHEDLPALAQLLTDGADAEDADARGFTLLHHAVDVEVDGAAQTGQPLHVDTTALLLTRGANPLAEDASGQTPLDSAERRGHWLAAGLFRAWLSRDPRDQD